MDRQKKQAPQSITIPPGRLPDAAPPEADAEARERYWRERTDAAHDAAEAFYKTMPPKRKLPKDG